MVRCASIISGFGSMIGERLPDPDPDDARAFASHYLPRDRVDDLLDAYWLIVGHGLHVEAMLSHTDKQSVLLETRFNGTFITVGFFATGTHLLGTKAPKADAMVVKYDSARLDRQIKLIKMGLM